VIETSKGAEEEGVAAVAIEEEEDGKAVEGGDDGQGGRGNTTVREGTSGA